jgi:ubiquinone/menaquinone biosynthesis C-methylase UbiE
MLKSNKESGDYLRQIGNNVSEKIGIIKNNLDSNVLPRNKDGKIKIIELGTGGGESLRHLKEYLVDYDNVKLLAVDIIPGLAASLKKEMEIEAIAADASNLPFADESISAINASAIFHEISSYGTDYYFENKEKNNLRGKNAIIKTLKEFNRVLLPGGKVAYRDVLAPQENLEKEKTVNYFNKSWKSFAKWFIDDFSLSTPDIYTNKQVSIKDTEIGFSITSSVRFQREFQRHYLMLRDYLRNVKNQEFGLTIISSVWLNEKEGQKFLTFSLDEKLASFVDLTNFESHNSTEGKIYRVNSDKFDNLYDNLMEHYFDELEKGSKEGINFRNLINTWKDREGLEHYIYGNITDMLEFSCEAIKNTEKRFVLFPELQSDITIAPRFYYDRYLKQIADSPERDGKQIISFKKIPIEQALKFINEIQPSYLNKDIFNEQIIEQLKTKIKTLLC